MSQSDINILTDEYYDKYGILLIFDEVQTGMGRTGKLYAYEHFGVRPDIWTSAKGIASGFPLSAVIARKEIMETWNAGAHGGTFGGNPVACAAALATLDVLTKDGALENAAKMGEYFRGKLDQLKEQHDCIGDVRGLGLMLAMEIVDETVRVVLTDECKLRSVTADAVKIVKR